VFENYGRQIKIIVIDYKEKEEKSEKEQKGGI